MRSAISAQRWDLIHEVQSLLTGGVANTEIVSHLMKKGVPQSSAYRYLRRAYADWQRQQGRFDKTHRLSKAIAERERAKRLALTSKRFVVVDGVLEKHEEPDVKAYLAALDSEARLLGLNAPEKHEVYVANFAKAMQMLVQLIAREVEDVALRGRLILGMRGIFEEAPKGKMLDSVSRETVIDAEVVSRETKGET